LFYKLTKGVDGVGQVEGVRIFGPPTSAPRGRAALCAFHVNGVSPKDVSNLMDQASHSAQYYSLIMLFTGNWIVLRNLEPYWYSTTAAM
jgi:hypothetical protein